MQFDPHQKEGIDWILTRRFSYLAHAPGAGKTLQAITAARMTQGAHPVLLVVPPSLTENWAREIHKWVKAPNGVSIFPSSHAQKEMDWDAEWLILPDSMITKDWVLSYLNRAKFRFVAVDEASRFKESTSQRTIALFGGRLKDGRLSQGVFRSAAHGVLLDGSPMPNRVAELWAPLFALVPGDIEHLNQLEFGFKYCGAQMNERGHWEFKGASNLDELSSRIQKSFMHVVGEERLNHPERLRSMLFMNEDVRSLEQKTWEKAHLGDFHFEDLDENETTGELATYRKELGMKKVPWVARYVLERLRVKNESILLFAWHREVVFMLSEALKEFPHGVVMGGTDQEDREASFEAFQKGEIKLLILNIAAGGRGHNLQKADRVIFAEYAWSNETNIQAEKRASRKGRAENLPVRCDYVVCPGSMDEIILTTIFRKAGTIKKVLG